MNFRKIIFLPILAFFLFTTSCKKGTTLTEDAIINIPASTSSLSAIDVKSIMDKADFEEVQKMAFYKDMIKDVSAGNPGLVAVLEDPYKSGVDLDSKAYIAQDLDLVNPQNAISSVILNLKDKAAFEALVTGGNSNVKSEDGFQYFQPSRNLIVSWNDKIAVMGMSQSFSANLKEGVAKIFSTTKETSIATNEDLQKCFSKDADMIGWFSSNAFAEDSKGDMGMAMAMAGFSPDMMKDNYAHSYFNFEKGEMVGESEYRINEKLADEFRHIFKDEVDTKFSNYLPAENLVFAFTSAIDMKGINMILKKKGMAGMADFQLKEFGLSMDGLANTFDGDIMVSAHRVEGNNVPSFLLATKIKDKDYFQKILNLGKEYRMLSSTADGVYNMTGLMAMDNTFGERPQIYVSGDMVFMGDASTYISKIQAGSWGKSGLVGSDVKNVVNDNLMGAFVNFNTIGKYLEMEDVDMNAMENGILRMDRDDATFKLEMNDKSKNSLKSLIEWANENYKNQQSM